MSNFFITKLKNNDNTSLNFYKILKFRRLQASEFF